MVRSRWKRGKKFSKSRFILFVLGILFTIMALGYAAWGITGQTHLERGLSYQKEGRLPAAVIEFRNAVEKAPNLLQARQALGLAYLNTGKFPLALGEFTRLAQVDPENPMVHRNLGKLCIMRMFPI